MTIPSLAWLSIDVISGVLPPNDKLAMNKDTVNPIPPSMAIENIIFQLVPSGIGASFNFTVSHEKMKIPNSLPITSAMIIAMLMPSNIEDAGVSRRNMPALANAKSGRII